MTDNNYDAILVTGNGFDLNLGLKTSYQDFIVSDTFNNLLKANNQLCIYLNNQHELNNWIDIENELKEYSNSIYKDSNRNIFRQEYQSLCKSLCDYLNNIDMSNIDAIDETSQAYKILTEKFERLLIFNFNYTLSIEYLLHKNKLNHTLFKVHGTAKENKIVFGVEDNARVNANDVFLKKSTCIWNKIYDIDKSLSNTKNIIFLGCSLGETDHHYFEPFFKTAAINNFMDRSRKNIFISYYGEEGMYNILKQIDDMTSSRIQGLRTHQNFTMFDLAE